MTRLLRNFAWTCAASDLNCQDGSMTEVSAVPEKLLIEGVAGEALTLPFPKGPATGYVWEWTVPDGVTRLPDLPNRRQR